MVIDNILGTGLSGLVGSRIVELLSQKISFEDVSRRTGTDITNPQAVLEKFAKSPSQFVLHLAAKTDVDGCEAEKNLGEQSDAWKINVLGTKHVIAAAEKTGKKIIYISTDMVFSGEQPDYSKYKEEDTPSPANFYAHTKYEAEKIVQAAKVPYLILRIAYPYRANFEKKEYVRIFKSLLEQRREIKAVSDHFFTPTFIDDLAFAFRDLLEKDITGIYHVVGDEAVSPYMVAKKVAKIFNLNESLIGQTSRAEYFKDKAVRGFNLALENGKIKELGVKLHSFNEGIEEIKMQLNA